MRDATKLYSCSTTHPCIGEALWPIISNYWYLSMNIMKGETKGCPECQDDECERCPLVCIVSFHENSVMNVKIARGNLEVCCSKMCILLTFNINFFTFFLWHLTSDYCDINCIACIPHKVAAAHIIAHHHYIKELLSELTKLLQTVASNHYKDQASTGRGEW